MLEAKTTLLVALGVMGAVYVWVLAVQVWWPPGRHRTSAGATPTVGQLGVGFVTNFFDSLGIGSFAPTTAVFRLWRMVPDEMIPGTLNAGHTLPAVAQAFVFIAIVSVDVTTLALMILAAVTGAWLGAGVVAGWGRRTVQVGMGMALLVAAVLLVMTNLDLFPVGGDAVGLRGGRLAVALSINLLLGALMTLGIGLYAPCMILVSLLGMNPITAFPIMMGSCAFLMPVGSIRFIVRRRFSLRPAMGLLAGGIPGVLVGAFVVKSLPLSAVRWVVVVVVVYTAVAMLMSALPRADGSPD